MRLAAQFDLGDRVVSRAGVQGVIVAIPDEKSSFYRVWQAQGDRYSLWRLGSFALDAPELTSIDALTDTSPGDGNSARTIDER